MHFIAMLAYKLPIPVDYNSSIVFASLALAQPLGFYIVSRLPMDRLHL